MSPPRRSFPRVLRTTGRCTCSIVDLDHPIDRFTAFIVRGPKIYCGNCMIENSTFFFQDHLPLVQDKMHNRYGGFFGLDCDIPIIS